jgi:hypothetical protein
MIRLVLKRKPYWLNLDHGVRLHVHSLTRFLPGGHLRAAGEHSSGAIVRQRPQPWRLLAPA